MNAREYKMEKHRSSWANVFGPAWSHFCNQSLNVRPGEGHRDERGRNPPLPLALRLGPDVHLHIPRGVGESRRDVEEGRANGGPTLALPRVRLDRGLR